MPGVGEGEDPLVVMIGHSEEIAALTLERDELRARCEDLESQLSAAATKLASVKRGYATIVGTYRSLISTLSAENARLRASVP